MEREPSKYNLQMRFSYVNIRRISQAFFLILFLFLVLNTQFRGSFHITPEQANEVKYPARLFLDTDPLIALASLVSSGRLYGWLATALIVLIPTFFLGRIYCGWICPFGTLHNCVSSPKRDEKADKRVERNKFSSYQKLKYYILVFFLVFAAIGSLQIGLLDPITFFTRSLTASILPGIGAFLAMGADAAYDWGGGIPAIIGMILDIANDIILGTSSGSFYQEGKGAHFQGAFLLGLLFVSILYLNRVRWRFFCRYICPLGALLGLSSKFTIYGMEYDHSKCTSCNKCLLSCQAAAEPHEGEWLAHECFQCGNCEKACPESAINFKFFPATEEDGRAPISLGRRRIIQAAASGIIIPPLLRASDALVANFDPRRIRPPGAVDEKPFLERCVRCGTCMKVCPNNALHPAITEAGLEGLFSPVLIGRIGYCEFNCVLCSRVCPTGAIEHITEAEKTGKGVPPVSIGTAFMDRGRCLPWAMGIPCIVCEEFCPTPKKAIRLEEVDAIGPDDKIVRVRRPHVIPSLCIGCAACEKMCPVLDKAAIRVTCIGETRSPDNRILLQSFY